MVVSLYGSFFLRKASGLSCKKKKMYQNSSGSQAKGRYDDRQIFSRLLRFEYEFRRGRGRRGRRHHDHHHHHHCNIACSGLGLVTCSGPITSRGVHFF
jgi:hypothetical protein